MLLCCYYAALTVSWEVTSMNHHLHRFLYIHMTEILLSTNPIIIS